AQYPRQCPSLVELNRNGLLDDTASRDPSDDRMISLRLGSSRAAYVKSTDGHRTLRDDVYLAIRSRQRCLQEKTSLQTPGIAKGRYSDVDGVTGLCKGRQRRGDHHSCHVSQA